MSDIEIPGPRRELGSYLYHMQRSYYRGMRRDYTWSCFMGWTRRLARQARSIVRERRRIQFVFCIADADAAVYCHEPYTGWDIEKYL